MSHAIRLPQPLSLPIRIIPANLQVMAMTQALNRLLTVQREDGELDFLHGKTLHVSIDDIGVSYALTFSNNRLMPSQQSDYDVKISGTAYDFMLLISRREDTDTLFFQRRLKMQGDTEMGLYLKNFLDGMDVAELPYYKYANPLLLKGISLLERFAGRKNSC
jgi:O2-independent ubiquinone biosynthesis accessory factor UbiT